MSEKKPKSSIASSKIDEQDTSSTLETEYEQVSWFLTLNH